MMRRWGCVCLVLVCAARLGAQSSQAPSTPSVQVQGGNVQGGNTTPPAAPARPRISPQQHLAEARRALEGVSEQSVPDDGRKILAQIRKDAAALESNYGGPLSPTTAWLQNLSDLERNVTLLIGSSNALSEVSATDTKKKPSKIEVTDPASRAALQAFRTHVELFYDAATMRGTGEAAPPPSAPPSA